MDKNEIELAFDSLQERTNQPLDSFEMFQEGFYAGREKDLNLVNVEHIIENLFSRYDTGIVGLLKPSRRDANLKNYKLRWRGDGFAAAGLAGSLVEEINFYRRNNEEKVDPDA